MRARASSAARTVIAASLCVACSSASPAAGTYTVDFPSTVTAIATDTIQVFVYPYDGSASACELLVEDRKSGVPLPAPVAQTVVETPCALVSGAASALPVGFGQYAFLAVASRQQYGDFLIGCAAQTVSATNTVVDIPLALTDFENPLPTSTCSSLMQSCHGGC